MLDFSAKVCKDAESVNDSDYALLYEHGFSDDDIWDIGAITAFFALSNRMVNVANIRPNDEFYLLGRLPR